MQLLLVEKINIYYQKHFLRLFMEAILMMLSRKNVVFIFVMAAMPFLCSSIWFSPKLSYHRIISLAVFLPMLSFSFYQKTYNYNSNVNPAIAAERSRASVLLSPQKSFGVGDPSLKLIKATRCHISNIGNYIHC